MHIAIIETETEEELVLTITQILLKLKIRVTLFLSLRVFKLLEEELKISVANVILLEGKIEKDYKVVNSYNKVHEIDLIIITRFNINTIMELYYKYLLVNRFKICSLIDSYERWLDKFDFKKVFVKGNINKRYLFEYLYTSLFLPKINSYLISDPHIESSNPIKLELLKRFKKNILEVPFKLMKNFYNPLLQKIDEPVFVIPGSIDLKRRDYNSILEIFSNIELYNKNWKLILLGRPIGKSGLQITQWCDTINLNYPQKKIFYETEYISKENFDKQLVDSNFIICPISSEHYKKGKDSGALYDILCFNKLGIIHEDYFYDENLLEKKVMFTYKDNEELKIMITNIINKTVSFSAINDQIKLFNEVFNEANYLQSIRYQLWKLIKE